MNKNLKAYFSLPGLFEFYDFYKLFLPLYYSHREYFYEWCEISSIYGSPVDCSWNGGRESTSDNDPHKVIDLLSKYNLSARLTFSNSLLKEEHLKDKKSNKIASLFENSSNGIIIYSDLLMNYIKANYPSYYFISSTTKVILNKDDLLKEINNPSFKYVVPDFRFNKNFDFLKSLNQDQKDKVELLCNECCYVGCTKRRECYEAVSQINLGLPSNHKCEAPYSSEGYLFSKAMENPSFISIEDIKNIYLPLGFTNFKIEGRTLGNALLLEFILYYLTKPEYVLKVREAIYLTNNLDLF